MNDIFDDQLRVECYLGHEQPVSHTVLAVPARKRAKSVFGVPYYSLQADSVSADPNSIEIDIYRLFDLPETHNSAFDPTDLTEACTEVQFSDLYYSQSDTDEPGTSGAKVILRRRKKQTPRQRASKKREAAAARAREREVLKCTRPHGRLHAWLPSRH